MLVRNARRPRPPFDSFAKRLLRSAQPGSVMPDPMIQLDLLSLALRPTRSKWPCPAPANQAAEAVKSRELRALSHEPESAGEARHGLAQGSRLKARGFPAPLRALGVLAVHFFKWGWRHVFGYIQELNGPTDGSGCVMADASEHGRSLMAGMPASPSAGHATINDDTYMAAEQLQSEAMFLLTTDSRPPVVLVGPGGLYTRPWPDDVGWARPTVSGS